MTTLTEAQAAISSALAATGDPAGLAKELKNSVIRALAERTGRGVTVEDRNGEEPIPGPGYLVKVEWADDDQSYTLWFPTEAQAAGYIEGMAQQYGRKVEGCGVDLTSPGCHTSRAWYEPTPGEADAGFADRLRQALAAKGWSQHRLAEETKIGPATVERWCQGRNEPRIYEVNRVAEMLDVGAAWLSCGQGPGPAMQAA